MEQATHKVILFYKFIKVEDPCKFRDEQKAFCESLGLKGRMIVGEEGVNATFEGTVSNVEKYKKTLLGNPMFKDIVIKESDSKGTAFPKLKIKVRDEIVTLGAGKFDIKKETARELSADELEDLYKNNEDFVVLDLRNDYEIKAGYFEKTINPNLKNFRDLPSKINELKHLKDKKVVAVCTGGIRCEKATCLLQKEGFSNIYQLKDGIHTYMEKYPGHHFKGTLFVFDNRMVTAVKETKDREIVGRCGYCDIKCESFYNNDLVRPSKKVICCDNCAEVHKHELRDCVANKL